ncbi:MAG: flagellar M-ring protein FliF C-terminal domain-containing protein [Fidelibacterota bacterium]
MKNLHNLNLNFSALNFIKARCFKTHGRIFISIFIMLLLFQGQLISQESQSQLAQKLMLENTLRERVTEALYRVLGDENFIINVKVDLNFSPAQKFATVIKPAEEEISKIESEFAKEKIKEELMKTPELEPILPGIPEIPASEQPMKIEKEEEKKPEEKGEEEEVVPKTKVVTQSVERSTPPLPTITKIEIDIILEDGVSPATMSNVRNVVTVAANLEPNRDLINILTASFKERKAEAEMIVQAQADSLKLKSDELIKTKEQLKKYEEEIQSMQSDVDKFPYYIVAGVGLVIILVLIILLIVRLVRGGKKKEVPVSVSAPEVPPEKAVEEAGEEEKAKIVEERAQALTKELQRSELKSTRQAIITLSVGKPDMAANIIKKWMQEGGE